MSLKPGIAKTWYQKFSTDVYPADEVVIRGKVMRPPKYYDRLYELTDEGEYNMEMVIRPKRLSMSKDSLDSNPIILAGWQRLQVKRQVTEARISQLKKTL